MPKLIVTSRYLKSSSGNNLSNYVKYIATREGAATVKENNGIAPATKKQQELFLFLVKEFPESTETFEYDDYKNNFTQKNASRFISEMLERNADRIADRENYVGYLANRPGAVKFGSHGLFSQENTSIDLEKTAKVTSGRTLFLSAEVTLRKWVTIICMHGESLSKDKFRISLRHRKLI